MTSEIKEFKFGDELQSIAVSIGMQVGIEKTVNGISEPTNNKSSDLKRGALQYLSIRKEQEHFAVQIYSQVK